ncbi:MAG: UDP-N-acetylglucosamine 2-epimerase (non-hydrolyzing) [Planctomycetes bacterium]|nr:UDP-N-acetylglucosamine 2-epimerase (non-hydrolyzing) [Planctomycetota bacterium]
MPSTRILVVIGTRPEAIKLAPVVHELRARTGVEVRVLATGQHRELLDGTLAFFGIEPDIDLDVMQAGQTLATLTSRLTAAIDEVLAVEKPDWVVAQGDTTTVFVAALGSHYRGIGFAHVEAGLRTGDKRAPFPEELNRSLVARLADLHFAPTARARDALLREGIDESTIEVTGNTAIDALLWTAERCGPFEHDPARRLVLVTAHRRESFGEPFHRICDALLELAARGDVEIVFPVHPNPSIAAPARERLGAVAGVRLVDPLDPPTFVAAMRASHLILTDSGGVQEEAPTLGKPVLVLRDRTERPDGIEAGAARLVGTDADTIVTAAAQLLDDRVAYDAMARVTNPYGDGQAARRIAARLLAQ